LETTLQLPRKLGHHPDYDDDVWLLNGRFGPFVQVGETVGRPKKGQPKPRRASVPKGMELPDVNLEHAIDWLRWPKALGVHPDSGEEVSVRPGRYGPYVQSGDERRNLKAEDDLETIELGRALELLAEPRPQRRGRGRGGQRRGRRRS
ncbi:MAG: DNA topoisomerase I, partial [Chloroflexi bacterium]|nr:DNA topoisomerase I [Chloroflexota bacterium]